MRLLVTLVDFLPVLKLVFVRNIEKRAEISISRAVFKQDALHKMKVKETKQDRLVFVTHEPETTNGKGYLGLKNRNGCFCLI